MISPYDSTIKVIMTPCTLFRPALNGCDMKVLAKYAEAGYSIAIQTAHHCDDTDDVCYHY